MAVLLFFQCLFSLNKVAATRSIVLVRSIQSKTHWRISLFTVRTTQVLFLIFNFDYFAILAHLFCLKVQTIQQLKF